MNSINRLKINGSSILILKTLKKEEYQESFIGSELLMERFTQYYDVKFNQFKPKLSLNDEEFHYSNI